MDNYDKGGNAFLGVSRSFGKKRWIDRLSGQSDRVALDISQKIGIDDLVARILAARDVTAETALSFLNPSIKASMPDPYIMQDMEQAAERLCAAVVTQEKIAIFGDYDVDGATSCAVLYRFFAHFDNIARVYIPDRLIEGYGPNNTAMKTLIDEGASLIITVDCGITSFEALDYARQAGVDVVVLDHHQANEALPEALAVVNANRLDDTSGLGHLAAVGVTFMAAVAALRLLRDQPGFSDRAKALNLLKLLDLVALGTVCDIVPLKTLNRAFVTKGLITMRQLENAGIAALSQAARVDAPLNTYHLGFLLGPRINAGGRIGNAALGAQLLTLDDPAKAYTLASELDRLNQERQAIERTILEEADAQAFAEIDQAGEGPPAILTSGDGWHAGVLGIVAARIKERYQRPAFAVAFDRQDRGTGSARSISGVDLGKVVREAVVCGILLKGGGHAMAAGLTIERKKLGDFRAFLEIYLNEDVTKARAENQLTIDGALTARAATLGLLNEIERAGPYGVGHPTPVFAFPAHRLVYAKVVGNGHVKLTIKSADGANLSGIAFRCADQPLGQAILQRTGEQMHFAGSLSKNSWQGRDSVQLRLIDAALTA